MSALNAPLTIFYATHLSVTIEPHRPLRLSALAWDFPERPDLIALTTLAERLDFLRDHLKSLCGIWDKLPRLFLDAYFRDIAMCIARDRSAIEGLAAEHGELFRPEHWSFAALCPLPQARLPGASETPVDFAFWTGETFHAIEIASGTSQSRARRDRLARLTETGIPVTEIAGAELERGHAGDLIARLPAPLSDFWKTEALPSSPFRIGALDEILSA